VTAAPRAWQRVPKAAAQCQPRPPSSDCLALSVASICTPPSPFSDMVTTRTTALSLTLLAVALLGVEAGDGMQVVDKDTYASLGIESSDDVWLIEFYSDMCGSCKEFKPTFVELGAPAIRLLLIRWAGPQPPACWLPLLLLALLQPLTRVLPRAEPQLASSQR
jgi:hypothetical protein